MNVTIVGDVMLGGMLSSNINKYKDIFLSDEVRKLLEADIVFCNLECVLAKAEAPPEKNKILLHAKSESIELLKIAGFNVVSLANNHIMDFGQKSLMKTMELLKKNNIKYMGAGKNLCEARKPIYFEKDNTKIALFAYAAPETWGGWSQRKNQTHKNWIAGADRPGVAPFDLKIIQEDIDKATKKSDFLIVSVHWGNESTYFPHPEIISDARKVIDMGANLVIGGHQHIIQGYEKYKDGLIMYGLSNFLFPSFYKENSGALTKWSRKGRESIILKCEISKNKMLDHRFIPTIKKKDAPIVVNPSLKTKNRILKKLEFLSKEYQKDNYHLRYGKLKRRESRFIKIKLILEMMETYGTAYMLKKIKYKLIKFLK